MEAEFDFEPVKWVKEEKRGGIMLPLPQILISER
jgi:hypothetical protein